MPTYAHVTAIRRIPNPAKRPVDGYGKKIPTDWQVQVDNEKTWRKVFAACFSNVASHYIVVKGKDFYLHDSDFPD